MKKILILILLLILTGCSKEETYFFTATVQEINDNGYIVIVDESDRDVVTMDLISITSDKSFKVGDRLIIEFDGMVMESYPGQINMISVELKE